MCVLVERNRPPAAGGRMCLRLVTELDAFDRIAEELPEAFSTCMFSTWCDVYYCGEPVQDFDIEAQ